MSKKKAGVFDEAIRELQRSIDRNNAAFESEFYEQENRELRAAARVLRACEKAGVYQSLIHRPVATVMHFDSNKSVTRAILAARSVADRSRRIAAKGKKA